MAYKVNPLRNDAPVVDATGAPNQLLQTLWQQIMLLLNPIVHPVTVAHLPTAGTAGRRAFVSDATATTFASIVAGGGANAVPVYDNGVNWIIG